MKSSTMGKAPGQRSFVLSLPTRCRPSLRLLSASYPMKFTVCNLLRIEFSAYIHLSHDETQWRHGYLPKPSQDPACPCAPCANPFSSNLFACAAFAAARKASARFAPFKRVGASSSSFHILLPISTETHCRKTVALANAGWLSKGAMTRRR